MREILFRGKRVDNGEWVEGYYHCVTDNYTPKNIHYITTFKKLDNGEIILTGQYDVVPETVGECTFFPDRNGKMIFEGDIIEGGYLNPLTNEFNSKKYAVEFKHATYTCKLIGHSPYGDTWLYFVHGDIIGNIHDNPKLLER